jgi:hypothetical protein
MVASITRVISTLNFLYQFFLILLFKLTAPKRNLEQAIHYHKPLHKICIRSWQKSTSETVTLIYIGKGENVSKFQMTITTIKPRAVQRSAVQLTCSVPFAEFVDGSEALFFCKKTETGVTHKHSMQCCYSHVISDCAVYYTFLKTPQNRP